MISGGVKPISRIIDVDVVFGYVRCFCISQDSDIYRDPGINFFIIIIMRGKLLKYFTSLPANFLGW